MGYFVKINLIFLYSHTYFMFEISCTPTIRSRFNSLIKTAYANKFSCIIHKFVKVVYNNNNKMKNNL